MAYLYSDYPPSMDPLMGHFQAVNQHQSSTSGQHHVTTSSRFHPYGRFLEQKTSGVTNDMQEKYRQYFDHSLLFSVYDDAISDVNKVTTNTLYANNINYNYPNLNFLHESSLKTGNYNRMYNETYPIDQLQNTVGHLYPNFGYSHNFGQYPQQDARRRMSPPEVGPTRTRDKYRVVYTDEQKIALEEEYEKSTFITEARRAELSNEINLSERQIKFWFQNRRVKDRRGKTSKLKKISDGKAKAKIGEKSTDKCDTENVDVTKRVTGTEELENLPPCRYSNVTQDWSCQGTVTHGDAIAIQPELDGCGANATYGCTFQSISGDRYPVSPSEWNGLSETSLLTTLNVSPILSSVQNETRS